MNRLTYKNLGLLTFALVGALGVGTASAAPLDITGTEGGELLSAAFERAGWTTARSVDDKHARVNGWIQQLPDKENIAITTATKDMAPHKRDAYMDQAFDKAIAPVERALREGFCYSTNFNGLDHYQDSKTYKTFASVSDYEYAGPPQTYASRSFDLVRWAAYVEIPEKMITDALYKKLDSLNGGKGVLKVCLAIRGVKITPAPQARGAGFNSDGPTYKWDAPILSAAILNKARTETILNIPVQYVTFN